MKISEIDSINSNYKANLIDFNQALLLVEKVKERELKKLKTALGFTEDEDLVISTVNKRLVKKYLTEEYPKRISVKKVTKDRVANEMDRVLKILGTNSIMTTDQVTLQHILNHSTLYSRETTRRLVCRINNLLQLAGRDFKLSKPQGKKIRRIPHLTEEELTLFISQLNYDEDKLAARIIFYTGLRTGELYALDDNDVDWPQRQIDITKQLTREYNIEPPKCNKDRTVIYPSHLHDDLEAWVDLDEDLRRDRRNGMSKRFLTASRNLWGKSKTKDISPHDLRRSFAIHLITTKSFSITEVAQLLGDTEKVTQDYYAGYSASAGMLNRLSDKLG